MYPERFSFYELSTGKDLFSNSWGSKTPFGCKSRFWRFPYSSTSLRVQWVDEPLSRPSIWSPENKDDRSHFRTWPHFRALMCTCMSGCIRMFVCPCTRMCVRRCVYVIVSTHVCVCVYTYGWTNVCCVSACVFGILIPYYNDGKETQDTL